MNLVTWIAKQMKVGAKEHRDVLLELAEAADVSIVSIRQYARGMKVGTYTTAKKISDATNGAVEVMALFEPEAPPKKAAGR